MPDARKLVAKQVGRRQKIADFTFSNRQRAILIPMSWAMLDNDWSAMAVSSGRLPAAIDDFIWPLKLHSTDGVSDYAFGSGR